MADTPAACSACLPLTVKARRSRVRAVEEVVLLAAEAHAPHAEGIDAGYRPGRLLVLNLSGLFFYFTGPAY